MAKALSHIIFLLRVRQEGCSQASGLRQRRARGAAGQDPDNSQIPPVGGVEGYLS